MDDNSHSPVLEEEDMEDKRMITGHNNRTLTAIDLSCRVGHSVLLRSERYVLLRSKKRTLHSFPFFS